MLIISDSGHPAAAFSIQKGISFYRNLTKEHVLICGSLDLLPKVKDNYQLHKDLG